MSAKEHQLNQDLVDYYDLGVALTTVLLNHGWIP